ncbi:hypothetical protein HYQ46_004930 [Verticillium longisporum]|nr:hypothetical protein HYQ46_004930 [Verticillium longisporum]
MPSTAYTHERAFFESITVLGQQELLERLGPDLSSMPMLKSTSCQRFSSYDSTEQALFVDLPASSPHHRLYQTTEHSSGCVYEVLRSQYIRRTF